MSIESAKLFIKKVNTNEVFASQAMEVDSNEGLEEFAMKAGFNFTINDLREAGKELSKETNRKLRDDELEMVTGGLPVFRPCDDYSTVPMCMALNND